jgi:hypothetical protein
MPSKYYAIAFPAWLGITLWFLISFYAASGQFFSHPKDSYFTLQDRASCLHPLENEKPKLNGVKNGKNLL